jgi:hypothetical protein
MLWLLVALFIDRVMLKLTMAHYTNEFSAGYGSIDKIGRKKALAPVAYRVLVPWMILGLERAFPALKKHRLTALYEPIRIGALTLALAATEYALGTPSALLVAALLPATFLFDFADWPFELLAFACALSGNLSLTILVVGLQGFARPETTPLAALTYGLTTHDPVGFALVAIAGGLSMGVVRIVQGKKPLVMPEGTALRLNIADLKGLFRNRPFYLSEVWISLTIIGVTLATILMGKAGGAWPIPLALCVAQVAWQARISESRSLTPCLLWIAAGALGGK